MDDEVATFRLATDRRRVWRIVTKSNGKRVRTAFGLDGLLNGKRAPKVDRALADLADAAFLRTKTRPRTRTRKRVRIIRIADLFSGCGLMTLGIVEAARAIGCRPSPIAAFDTNENALRIYKTNFPMATTKPKDLRELLGGRMRARPKATELALKKMLGRIDIAVAGPPCQGHSDLNNYTRRHDPKNGLYYRVARFAKIIRPTHLIIENVPAVLHDKGHVVSRTRRALENLGYRVDDGVVNLLDLGVPQTRRRHVMVASLSRAPSLKMMVEHHRTRKRSVRWTIGDLRGERLGCIFDTAGDPTPAMARRIRYLFDQERYDLPNYLRPDCHRGSNHTYKSVYGRLRWGQPAQTITSGFRCMGQGRFVHPSAQRTLTPHEAARLQLIPDFFSFGDEIGKAALAEMIGNAVPPKLTYVVGLELLR
jgi:DNA (cytosine-5)-methyltransferase 1